MKIGSVLENLHLTRSLFKGIIQDKNYEQITDVLISWKNYIPGIPDLIYTREYESLVAKRQFTFLLIDDSIVQAVYKFDKRGEISVIRLAYYPRPELKKLRLEEVDSYYDDSINDYFKEQYFLMFDIISSDFKVTNSNHFRIDYNSVHESHCKNHLQFGSINDIRLPVDNLILPFTFIDFIAKNLFSSSWNAILGTPDYKFLKSRTDSLYMKYQTAADDENIFITRSK